MPAILLLLPQILALVPSITVGLSSLFAWIASIRTAAKQDGQWTDELESAFIDALLARRDLREYQTDEQLGAKFKTDARVLAEVKSVVNR